MTRKEAIDYLINHPARFARLLGFDKMTDIHNEWIKQMIMTDSDATLQAHRGSFKTTCLSIALSIIVVLFPQRTTAFMRKTDDDVKEIVAQVKKILQSGIMKYFVQAIWCVDLKLTTDNATEITTNLKQGVKGTEQLSAFGVKGSLTGKHFDFIFTDDIVNVSDRLSRAEREHTKIVYDELNNLINRDKGCRIFNIGTPWHKEDAFCKMPDPQKFDCYQTGLMTEEEIAEKKAKMEASLFAANYELKHIAAADVLFDNPQFTDSDIGIFDGAAHVDASYGGEDGTAFTLANYKDGKYYVLGKLYHKHVDDCLNDIYQMYDYYHPDRIRCEMNADKGYLSKEIRKTGRRTYGYSEKMNKYIKIASYVKLLWKDIIFVSGTDQEYISQILDFNENADHDDAPDSLACLCREFVKKDVAKKQEYEKLYGQIESERVDIE